MLAQRLQQDNCGSRCCRFESGQPPPSPRWRRICANPQPLSHSPAMRIQRLIPNLFRVPNDKQFALFLVSLTLFAFLLRVLLMVADGSLWMPITSDGVQYHGLAENLASGRGYTLSGYAVVNRMPGYPALLALLY